MGESMSITRRKRLEFTLKRFIGFIKIFLRNKRGVLGLTIIIFFSIMALGAPLFTPYTPLGTDPNRILQVSSSHAAPAWLRYLPSFLGGNPTLSETLVPIKNPSEMRLINEGGEFMFNGDRAVKPSHVSDINFPYSKEGSGCLSLHFEFNETVRGGNVTATIYKEFSYPFSGPPGSFFGSLMLLVNGTVDENGTLKIPVEVKLYLQAGNGTKMKLYPPPGYIYSEATRRWERQSIPSGFTAIPNSTKLIIDKPQKGSINGWITPVTFFMLPGTKNPQPQSSHICSTHTSVANILKYEYNYTVLTPVRSYLPVTPANYKLGVDVTFIVGQNASIGDYVTVYMDELDLILYGSCFGLMGTNHLGQDLFAQLVYGSRVSLYVGLLSALLSVSIGLIVGLAAGFLGGAVDEALMRINDFMLVIPGLPLMMVLVTILGTRIEILIIILGLLGWNGFARLVRSQVLSLKESAFVEATRAVGASRAYIIFRHMVPNVMPLVYVSLATSVPGSITAEAALSWLGFADPYRVSWGKMLRDFQTSANMTQWWWVVPPGICIAALALSFILLGFALDDILNPKLRQRR